MKTKLLALAIGLFAVGAAIAPAYAAQCKVVRCWIDPVTKQRQCSSLCPGGSLQL